MQEIVHDLQVMSPTLVRPDYVRAGFAAHVDDAAGSGLVEAGEQWAPPSFMIEDHAHRTWEFYLQLHGLTRWTADGRRWTVRPGELLAVAPETVHAMAEQPRANIHFVYAAFDLARCWARVDGLAQRWSEQDKVIHLHHAADLTDSFAQLVNEVTAQHAFQDAGLTLAVDRIALELTRHLDEATPGRALDGHPAVQQTQVLLDREYARPWPLSQLADRVGLAPNYLAAVFSSELGRGPHQYQTERKINRAKQLLRNSDLTVTAIAIEVGFNSGQHMARTFRVMTGVTPSAYRRTGQGGQ